ncbi:head-tail joining protein [Wolbachia endosymbiont of Rhagoletis cingulata]|uniref:head-tail joining protein n=1 Tax=Wolbachia endosymbiont of Rhagoletis cingulata TaxID=1220542 RepID=UPI003AF3F275
MQENVKKLLKDCLIHLGELALYESKNKSYMVQVLKQEPDKLYEIGEGQFVGKMLILEVSIFDVLKPMVGDIFVISDCKYKIHTPPLRDKSGMVWRIEAYGV